MYAKFIQADGRFAFSDQDNGGVQIAQSAYDALFSAQSQGKQIVPDANGYPVAFDPVPTTAQLAEAVRAMRDMRLSATDWTQLPDVPAPTASKWATYRQALRDVPAQAGFPASVVWPTQPV